ncbi:MAG: zf-TFIIB domain-containing protein [Acidobacteria bacterium]|nr:zf-TFIIB domain-containing protein [Acidobacteriota bacterium]
MTDARIKSGVYNCPNCGAAATPESVRCAYCHSSLATIVCSKCFGAIFTGMKHCPWCGGNAAEGKPVERAKGKCPRCNETFLLVQIKNRNLEECPACGGLWIDNETLQEICTNQEQQQAVMGFSPEPASAAGSPVVLHKRTYIPCPRCNKLMNRRQFAGCSGVIVDWCKAHGTWFDRNELRQIVQFILDGGLGRAREREKAKLEEARQSLREERRNLEMLARLGGSANLDTAEEEKFNVDLFNILGGIWRSLKNGE